MSDLLTISATELAAGIRAGRWSSREVVDAHIAEVERVNPDLNAVVYPRFAEARQEAEAADARRALAGPDDLPPLHGVPCTIKECFALTGMPQTAGLVSRTAHRAPEDATAVGRYRAAGAIPMGVTNTSELCMWMESSNEVYGRTNNPYDLTRMVGGSSGGEGAIIGAGASPFGLGSDVGGSIRMPAYFNGVFGHKPTGGLIPGSGQFPNAKGDALRYLTTGPLCRKADDLWPLVKILAGPDGIDSGCRDWPLGDPAAVSLRDLPVTVVPGRGAQRTAANVTDAIARAASALGDQGASIRAHDLPRLNHSLEIWASMLGETQGHGDFRTTMGRPQIWELGVQLLWWVLGLSPHTLPAIGLGLLEDVGKWTPKRTARMVAEGVALRAELIALIGDGVLLYPSYPTVAPKHHHPLFPPINYAHVCVFNVMELPVTQVPLGLSDEGLPLGVQVIGAPGQDHVTVAVAQALERGMGGWVPPGR